MSTVKTKYRYSVNGESYRYQLSVYGWQRQEYDLTDEYDLELLVETCADDYHGNHDGYEHRSWCDGSEPLVISIWTTETTSIDYDVWLEYTPSYDVRPKQRS